MAGGTNLKEGKVMTHYKRNTTPGKTPTKKELGLYLGRIASLGQIDYYKFSSHPAYLVIGVFLFVGALVTSLVMVL